MDNKKYPHSELSLANDRSTIDAMQADQRLSLLRREIYAAIAKYRYTYNFTWYGRPIIQLPDDIVTIQELILTVRPDVVVETGVAHGGSLMLSASMLELLGNGQVIGVDIDIRPANRDAILAHPLSGRIRLIQGSSVDEHIVKCVQSLIAADSRVMVFLDSNHTHDHVLRELELYSPLVRKGSYLVVFDTGIEDMPADAYPDRPWGKGNNPKTAVRDFLKCNNRFAVDQRLENRLLWTVAPGGYLVCVED